MKEMKSLTLNGKTYDSFPDKTAVKTVNGVAPDEMGNVSVAGSGGGLTAAQVNAMDALFRSAAYTEDVSAKYAAFRQVFDLDNGGGDDTGNDNGGGEDDTGNEQAHTHSYTAAVTTAATCTAAGTRTYTCSCGHSYTEAIPATGHNYVDGVCTVCGAADPDHDEPASVEPVYQLAEAVTFDGTNRVDTGFYPIQSSNKPFSIAYEYSAEKAGRGIFVAWDYDAFAPDTVAASMLYGYVGGNYGTESAFCDVKKAVKTATKPTNEKIVLVYDPTVSKKYLTVHYVENNVHQSSPTPEGTYTAYPNAQIVLGVSPYGNSVGDTTMHQFVCYNRALSGEEITSFLGV